MSRITLFRPLVTKMNVEHEGVMRYFEVSTCITGDSRFETVVFEQRPNLPEGQSKTLSISFVEEVALSSHREIATSLAKGDIPSFRYI